MKMLEKAILIALEAHRGQVDKGGEPYILHPLRVMLAMKRECEKIAAVLHDVVEDSVWTLGMLKVQDFSDEVLDAVGALTRRSGESYSDFINRVGLNSIAREVKIADLKDNSDLSRIQNPSEVDFVRRDKYEGALRTLKAIRV